MRQRHFIDTHKAATAPFVAALMLVYDAWDRPAAWLYLALHGTYGLLWVWKSRVFPDRSWERETSFGYGLAIWGGLSLYWIAPWLLVSRPVEVPAWWAAACVSVYAVGVFLHFASDMQKYAALQARPEHLITGGLFARCRNPNYLGELLIYVSFAALVGHWLPFAVLVLWLAVVWIPNMRQKDRSLARYPGFEAWRRRSWLFFPPLV